MGAVPRARRRWDGGRRSRDGCRGALACYRLDALVLTVHARAPADALAAGHDGRTAAERRAGRADVEADCTAVRAEMVEVARGLGVEGVVTRGRAGLDDENAQGGVGIRKAPGDNACACAACRGRER